MLACFDPEKLADVQTIADKLAMLPRETLIYIAGYAEGARDKQSKKPDQRTAG